MLADQTNTDDTNIHLKQISMKHRNWFIAMVLDGASSHRGHGLEIPKNMALIQLPPYSPELNPAEHVWRILRKSYFVNVYFDTLDQALQQAVHGLKELSSDKKAIKSLTNWPWISDILK
jgi:transposase